MAGIANPVAIPIEKAGPFSRLARGQYAALGAMRWSMFRNSIRSVQGAVEFGARTISTLMFAFVGLAIAFGLGAGAAQAAAHGRWMILALLMWLVFLLWQMVPITIASFQQQFDMSSLLRFPLGFGTFLLLHLIFGLVDLSTVMGSLACLGIWIGITIERPALAPAAAIALLAFAAFNVLLVRAIFAWIDRWLAQRRTREMVTALFFIGILAINVFNPAFRQHDKFGPKTRQATLSWMRKAEGIQRWFPAGAAAQSISGAGQGNPLKWAEFLALLGVWGAASGGVFAVRLHAEFRGENFSEAPARASTEAPTGKWLLDGSGPIAAVLEKELRTLIRAVPLLYGLAAPLVMVFLFAGMFRGGSRHPLPFFWGLLICVGYTVVGFTQLLYNNLGTEGTGIQLLFLSPTPIRKVLLAKNIFHSILLVIDAALVTLLVCFRYGGYSLLSVTLVWAWFLFALPLHLGAGNLFSLAMPYRVNMGRIGRQKGSQANALLSLLVQALTIGVGASIFALCSFYGRLWMAIPILLILGIVAVIGWIQILARVDNMANNRREELMSQLARTE